MNRKNTAKSIAETNSTISDASNDSIKEIHLNKILNKSTNNPGLNTHGKISEYDHKNKDPYSRIVSLNKKILQI
jgi:hypothetical protein